MAQRLILSEIAEGRTIELGDLSTTEVLIGREPGEGGIVLERQGVSRIHGRFLRARNHWLFSDQGSTNGSWLNGEKLEQGQWRIVRNGDLIQLADRILRLSGVEEDMRGYQSASALSAVSARSLLVISNDQFLDEYLVPEYGRALVIGGNQCDLAIEGTVDELPALVVERKGLDITAFRLGKQTVSYLGDTEITSSIKLKDNDEIRVAGYIVVINDPSSSARPSTATAAAPVTKVNEWVDDPNSTSMGSFSRGSDLLSRSRPATKLPFGQAARAFADEAVDETIAIDPREVKSRLSGYDMHPSMRMGGGGGENKPEFSFGALEDKLVVVIGGLLLLGLIVFVVLWVVTG